MSGRQRLTYAGRLSSGQVVGAPGGRNVSRGGRAHASDAGRPAQSTWLTNCTAWVSRDEYFSYFVGLAIVASLAVGCSESSSTPTSSSASGSPAFTADQLAGTWNLLSILPTGQAERATPAGATYNLTFADGRLSTRVDCNTCSGAFALSGQTLTAGPTLACTRAACPTMAFENAYTSLLGGESTVTVSGGTLVLSSARGVLRFTR
jgi:heat shock protein HslJ